MLHILLPHMLVYVQFRSSSLDLRNNQFRCLLSFLKVDILKFRNKIGINSKYQGLKLYFTPIYICFLKSFLGVWGANLIIIISDYYSV